MSIKNMQYYIKTKRRSQIKNLTIFLFLLLSVIGCSAENPLCTDNYCVTGEIFPRSDLETGAEFSEVAIDDSQLFAILAGATPVETAETTDAPSTTSTTMSNIVSDVADGGTAYLEQTVTITATVKFNLLQRSNLGGISLITNTEAVSFFVTDYTNPESLREYQEGQQYTFTLFIRSVDPPEDEFDNYAIWSNETN